MKNSYGVEIPDGVDRDDRDHCDEIMRQACVAGGYGAISEGERKVKEFIDQRYEPDTRVRRRS